MQRQSLNRANPPTRVHVVSRGASPYLGKISLNYLLPDTLCYGCERSTNCIDRCVIASKQRWRFSDR